MLGFTHVDDSPMKTEWCRRYKWGLGKPGSSLQNNMGVHDTEWSKVGKEYPVT